MLNQLNPLNDFDPWTQADDLQLQSYTNGLAEARKKRDLGEIDDNDYFALEGQLKGILTPLLQRKVQADKLAETAQVSKIQNQNAMVQSMQQHDAVFRANGLQDRIQWLSDPMTGQRVAMLEKEPNKWDQIEFPEQPQQEQKDQPEEDFGLGSDFEALNQDPYRKEGSPVPFTGQMPEEAQTGQGGQVEEEDLTTMAGLKKAVASLLKDATPEQLASITPEQKKALETIQNATGEPTADYPWMPKQGFSPTLAQRQVQEAVKRKAQVPREIHDRALLDRQAQEIGMVRDPSLTMAQHDHLWRMAESTVRLPPGPHRDAAVWHAYQNELQHAQRTQEMAIRQESSQRLQAMKQSSVDARQQKALDARGGKQQVAEGVKMTDEHIGKLRKENMEALQKEFEQRKKEGTLGENPDLHSAETMNAAADRKTVEDIKSIQGIKAALQPKQPTVKQPAAPQGPYPASKSPQAVEAAAKVLEAGNKKAGEIKKQAAQEKEPDVSGLSWWQRFKRARQQPAEPVLPE